MVIRTTTVIVPERATSEFIDAWQTEALPKYDAVSGVVFVCFLERRFRSYSEFMVQSAWKSTADADHFVQSGLEHWPNTGGVIVLRLDPREYEVVSFSGETPVQTTSTGPRL